MSGYAAHLVHLQLRQVTLLLRLLLRLRLLLQVLVLRAIHPRSIGGAWVLLLLLLLAAGEGVVVEDAGQRAGVQPGAAGPLAVAPQHHIESKARKRFIVI